MGSPAILYCGPDECLRVPVLRMAGFRVAHCASVTDMQRQLADAPEVALVVCEEAPGRAADQAADLARASCTAGLVLFRHPAGESSEERFDLVIEPGTLPVRWLQQLAETLAARATPGWAQVARDLQARRRDLPPDEEAAARRYRIQLERRKCT